MPDSCTLIILHGFPVAGALAIPEHMVSVSVEGYARGRGGHPRPGRPLADPADLPHAPVAGIGSGQSVRVRRTLRCGIRIRPDVAVQAPHVPRRSPRHSATQGRFGQRGRGMHFYLPVAEMSANILTFLAMGGAVGFLSGLFGVGGGFLMTPLLIFSGIPPAVAVGTEFRADRGHLGIGRIRPMAAPQHRFHHGCGAAGGRHRRVGVRRAAGGQPAPQRACSISSSPPAT